MIIKKYKQTKQRELILSILKGTRIHPSAEWIYEEARKSLPRISKGTVYRNLTILKERGEISGINPGGTVARFEARLPSHYHFSCQKCGKIVDINMPIQNKLNEYATKATGFQITDHKLEFTGYCKQCQ